MWSEPLYVGRSCVCEVSVGRSCVCGVSLCMWVGALYFLWGLRGVGGLI